MSNLIKLVVAAQTMTANSGLALTDRFRLKPDRRVATTYPWYF